ncbi:hypothetical protein [Terrabacter terrigena]|uniref:Uncharacterized protein n=1 Tax=Terrabacter terrigena TaxID=574718 RepID=A0ABW3MZT8_9MICO
MAAIAHDVTVDHLPALSGHLTKLVASLHALWADGRRYDLDLRGPVR